VSSPSNITSASSCQSCRVPGGWGGQGAGPGLRGCACGEGVVSRQQPLSQAASQPGPAKVRLGLGGGGQASHPVQRGPDQAAAVSHRVHHQQPACSADRHQQLAIRRPFRCRQALRHHPHLLHLHARTGAPAEPRGAGEARVLAAAAGWVGGWLAGCLREGGLPAALRPAANGWEGSERPAAQAAAPRALAPLCCPCAAAAARRWPGRWTVPPAPSPR